MAPTDQYDAELEMYVEQPHELDQNHLRFMAWLIDHGRMVIRDPEPEAE